MLTGALPSQIEREGPTVVATLLGMQLARRESLLTQVSATDVDDYDIEHDDDDDEQYDDEHDDDDEELNPTERAWLAGGGVLNGRRS